MLQIDLLQDLSLDIRLEGQFRQVFDIVRKRWVSFSPEEHVRQALIHYLCNTLQYPVALIAVEKQVRLGTLNKRFDIVVYNREHRPWMLLECKAPDVPVSAATLFQLLQYQHSLQCRYWVLSNGISSFAADALLPDAITWLDTLPPFPAQ